MFLALFQKEDEQTMSDEYFFRVLSALLLVISSCVIVATDFNGLAALIFILPMVLESLKATNIRKSSMVEKATDIVALIVSSLLMLVIVLYMLEVSINPLLIKIGLFIYPFYEMDYAILEYLKK